MCVCECDLCDGSLLYCCSIVRHSHIFCFTSPRPPLSLSVCFLNLFQLCSFPVSLYALDCLPNSFLFSLIVLYPLCIAFCIICASYGIMQFDSLYICYSCIIKAFVIRWLDLVGLCIHFSFDQNFYSHCVIDKGH